MDEFQREDYRQALSEAYHGGPDPYHDSEPAKKPRRSRKP